MATAKPNECETYRVIVLGKNGIEVLVAPNGDRFALPAVNIPRWQRVAENLTAAVKADWGQEVVCLFEPEVSASANAAGTHYQATEHWRTSGKPKVSTQWVPLSALSHDSLIGPSDYLTIQQSIALCSAQGKESPSGPFARLGWFKELSEWVATIIEPLGFHLNGDVRQLNASPSFSLVRFETDGPALWFKAVGEPNQKEFLITCTLAQLFLNCIPGVLAARPDLNGWLTREAAGKLLGGVGEDALWQRAAAALAELQIDSIDHGTRILGAGARDLGAAELSKLIQPFMESMAELMERQTKVLPAALGRDELLLLGDRIQSALDTLEALGIPETLGHLDLNPGNIIVSPSRCTFLDWAEAYVGNPFFSLEYLREHLRRTSGTDSAVETKLVEAYCAQWEQVVPTAAVVEGLALAPLLAVFAYAAGSNAWEDAERLEEPANAGYFRSLTRRMHREATELADQRVPMPALMEHPPYSDVEDVTEVLHGVPVTDPYRWLEDQESPRTREWLSAQTRYARSYLDSNPGREYIRERIRQLLDVETYDSLQKVGGRYFFRKRVVGQEQPCICSREGRDGSDQVLVDPALRDTGPHTAVKPLRISPDGRLLLYEVKQGGERTGTFELLDIETRETLPDVLPRGYLRGFAFGPDSQAFYYVHEALEAKEPYYRAAYKHVLGTSFAKDKEVFFAGEGDKLRLHIVPGTQQLGFLVVRFEESTLTDFYLWPFESTESPEPVIQNAQYMFGPVLTKDDHILAITDREAPNFRIVEIRRRKGLEPELVDLVPSSDSPIQNWAVSENRVFVSYVRKLQTEIDIFDLSGRPLGHVPVNKWDTVHVLGTSDDGDELFFEQESFTKPVQIWTYCPGKSELTIWADRKIPFDAQSFCHTQVWFAAKDGTQIPMFLVGRPEILDGGTHPTIMTSYGGYGVPMTPQFSVFVAFLIERGCLFALPNIRGGSEFGAKWHTAAKCRKRQVAFDDFLAAAEWLIETGRSKPHKLAIFGGSNSGLLVGAAMTQRPDLFRAVICMVPMLDMLRYHLFDNAHLWKDEFGTADDPEDLAVLLSYSPYHNVHGRTAYPATMIVSGDSDQNCNPLHARKMTARLQAANVSGSPIFLDYSRHRGHSPVLPLSERIEALTDRMAFLCDQLQLTA